MGNKLKMGIIGCGDFLRWQASAIKNSTRIEVAQLFDLDTSKAEKYASELGGTVVNDADSLLSDNSIDLVCLFVPPWVRKDLLTKAAEAGKQIITTKPLGNNVKNCEDMLEAVGDKIKCGVIYTRTGNTTIETYKKIFGSGDIGNLAIYKQDWIHHYPEWNDWATDPEKNGGPFMDAMIHNLNVARYLMSRKATKCTLFSDSYAHDLKCADTESMKIDFEQRGSAYLFITWAADLAVYSKEGNDREHIDILYMVTDKGWRVTEEKVDGKRAIVASKEGEKKHWEIIKLPETHYDRFAAMITDNAPFPSDFATVQEAYEDIKILEESQKNAGCPIDISM